MENNIKEGETIIKATRSAPTDRSIQGGQADIGMFIDNGNSGMSVNNGNSGTETRPIKMAETETSKLDQIYATYGKRNHNHNLGPRRCPNFQHMQTMFHMQTALLTEQMSTKKGLKVFGKQGAEAIIAEMYQVYYQKVTKPVKAQNI